MKPAARLRSFSVEGTKVPTGQSVIPSPGLMSSLETGRRMSINELFLGIVDAMKMRLLLFMFVFSA